MILSGIHSYTGMFKNKIINGNFDIWQRGTTTSAVQNASVYMADRWMSQNIFATSGSITSSRQSFGLGDLVNEPTYYHRSVVVQGTANGNYSLIQQMIEDVRTFAGKKVSISFWAKADATKNMSIELQQNFGTGGSPSTTVSIPVQKITLSTSWQKFKLSTTVPSIAGKNIGTTANTSNLALVFWFDAGSSYNSNTNTLGRQSGIFDIAQVQIEEGDQATNFELRPIQIELALCQRYYIEAVSSSVANVQIMSLTAVNSGTLRGAYSLPVAMRIAPVLSYSNLAHFDITGESVTRALVSMAVSGQIDTYNTQAFVVITVPSSTIYIQYALRVINTSAKIGFDAEF